MKPASADQLFTDRLRSRQLEWWGKDQPLTKRLHRLRELTRHHRPEDPDDVWRCCSLWQRALTNKLNGRAFARRHGVPVPENYWRGRRPGSIPWNRIPQEFVVKPEWGRNKEGVYVLSHGRDQVRNLPMTRSDLIGTLDRTPSVAWVPWLVEEHVRRPDGSYGESLEYRFHVFRDRVEAIATLSRQEKRTGLFTPEWELLPEPLMLGRKQEMMPRPDCLDEMTDAATRLGMAYGTYVRVDIFWTDDGFRFNEFATTPSSGYGIAPFADEYFGNCWQRMVERFPGDPPSRTHRTES